MQGILEGLLFIGGDEGVTIDKVKEVLEIDDEKLNYLINNLKESYESADRGICLDIDSDLLSTAALETLAIIAYNQPMVRSQVDEVRGVDSSYNIRRLVLKGLIEEKGRSELPGRPILYGTTDKFLSHFGLSNLSELPKIEEEEVVDEDVDLFESKYQEN